MKLQAYLDRENLTYAEFGRRIGASKKNPTRTVARIAQGEITPSPRLMESIAKHTNGEVRPDDFFDLPTPAPSLRAAAQPTACGP